MKPFKTMKSSILPLNINDVDTDQIIPKQFLKLVHKTGFGKYLFFDWRYESDGEKKKDFPLNDIKYHSAEILLTQSNFGCGSSREHAVWSIADYGFKVIIAPSFADIFYNNCFNNSVLPITLKNKEIDYLFNKTYDDSTYLLNIDLVKQEISDSKCSILFDIDASLKNKLIQGLDDIDVSLKYNEKIKKYESNIPLFRKIVKQ